MTAGIVASGHPEKDTESLTRLMMETWEALCSDGTAVDGGSVRLDEVTMREEKRTADNNFAIAYNLRGRKGLPRNVDLMKMLDLYFANCSIEARAHSRRRRLSLCTAVQQGEEGWRKWRTEGGGGRNGKMKLGRGTRRGECLSPSRIPCADTLRLNPSLSFPQVTCKMLSVAAATLANGGVNPFTQREVFDAQVVRNVLCQMSCSGMYDGSGAFTMSVGLPAKSGVSGAVMVVIPNLLGFATFSPRLDENGNSTRGIEFFRRLTASYRFHIFEPLAGGNTGMKQVGAPENCACCRGWCLTGPSGERERHLREGGGQTEGGGPWEGEGKQRSKRRTAARR